MKQSVGLKQAAFCLDRRQLIGASAFALACAGAPRPASAGFLSDLLSPLKLAEKPDQRLHGVVRRMGRFLRKRAVDLVGNDLNAFMAFADGYRSNGAVHWAVQTADFFAGTGSDEPDEDLYLDILTTVIMLSDCANAADVTVQAGFDDLKSAGDWIADGVRVTGDLVSVIAGPGAASIFADAVGIATDLIEAGLENAQDIADCLAQLEALCRNYSRYDLFLQVLEDGSSGDLRAAARKMREYLGATFALRLDQAGDVAGGLRENVGEAVFDNFLMASLKESDVYTRFPSLVNKAEKTLNGLNFLQDSFQLGAILGKSVGQLLVGGEDLIVRLREICALHDICEVLQRKLRSLEGDFYDRKERGDAAATRVAEDYVNLAGFLLVGQMRGEYCIYAIICEDAGLMSAVLRGNSRNAREWYDRRCGQLDVLSGELKRILLRGIATQNNGGRFIGAGETVYFAMRDDRSVESPGLFAYFADKGSDAPLVRLDTATGQVTHLDAEGFAGNLWASDTRLFYRKDGSVCSLPIAATLDAMALPVPTYSLTPQLMEPLTGTLLCHDYAAGQLVGIDGRTGRITPYDVPTWQIVAAQDGYVYLAQSERPEDGWCTVTVYCFDLLTDTLLTKAVRSIPCEIGCGVEVDAYPAEEDLFISLVVLGGTAVASGAAGELLRCDVENGFTEVLADTLDQTGPGTPILLGKTSGDGASTLFFTRETSLMGAGFNLMPWVEDGVYSLDAQTVDFRAVTFPLFKDGSFALLNGELVTHRPETPDVMELVASRGALQTLGLGNLQDLSSGEGYVVENVEVVGDVAFFTVDHVKRDPQADMGWRPAYDRLGSAVYRAELGTDALELIYEY